MTDITDVAEKNVDRREYYKNYYHSHREHIVKLVADRKKLLKGSDLYRQKLIEELNGGKRKWVYIRTREKYGLQQDPKTLLWS